MVVAVLQTIVKSEKEENLREAEKYIKAAAEQGAGLAILPEMFCCPYSNDYFKAFAEPAGGRIWTFMAQTAAKYRIAVAAGSMPESEGGRLYNSSFVFDRTGRQIARHRKVHLFDVDFKGGQYFKESDTFTGGEEITLFDLEGMRFGLCICFDMRFPEMSRLMALEGAETIIAPAAFNMTTGPMHWETMFRQRAVDEQVFTIGCAPARDENAEYVSYANSLVVSPLGEVIARAGSGEEMLLADIDHRMILSAREQLPLVSARRMTLKGRIPAALSEETLRRSVPAAESPDYDLMAGQLRALTEGVSDTISNLANAASLLYQTLPDINWAGFYLLKDGCLKLGPFMGKPACVEIGKGRGVCGKAAEERQTIVVPDVHEFPGHIACDAASRSEIVIPLTAEGKLFGVMDIDSERKDRFREEDRIGLERFARVLERVV